MLVVITFSKMNQHGVCTCSFQPSELKTVYAEETITPKLHNLAMSPRLIKKHNTDVCDSKQSTIK